MFRYCALFVIVVAIISLTRLSRAEETKPLSDQGNASESQQSPLEQEPVVEYGREYYLEKVEIWEDAQSYLKDEDKIQSYRRSIERAYEGESVRRFVLAAMLGDIDTLIALKDKVDIDAQDKWGITTPLGWVVDHEGSMAGFFWLLDHGANPDVPIFTSRMRLPDGSCVNNSESLLGIAAEATNHELYYFLDLITRRPDLVKKADRLSGRTALHTLTYGSWKRIYEFPMHHFWCLIALGADLDAVDKEGHTPLYHAMGGDNYMLMHLLLTNGATPRIPPLVPPLRSRFQFDNAQELLEYLENECEEDGDVKKFREYVKEKSHWANGLNPIETFANGLKRADIQLHYLELTKDFLRKRIELERLKAEVSSSMEEDGFDLESRAN